MKPQHAFASHVPLVLFTWAMLLAAGLALGVALGASPQLTLWALALLAFGGLASLLHLGRKTRAPMSIKGFAHSWLSREALASGLFGTVLGASLVDGGFAWPAALLGLGLGYAIVRLYALPAQPLWCTWSNQAAPVLAVTLAALILHADWWLLVALGTADFGLTLVRLSQLGTKGVPLVFPHLGPTVRRVLKARLVTTPGVLLLVGTHHILAALLLHAAGLLLDRIVFYAGARQYGPSREMAAMKAGRMAKALH